MSFDRVLSALAKRPPLDGSVVRRELQRYPAQR
jgi:hypothetical protein